MTSMRMRLVSSVSFVALLLKRCRLPCEALVAASCCFTFETSTMQKPRVFGAFQTKLRNEPQKPSKIQDEKTWYLRQIRKKRNQKTRPKYYGTEIRNIVLLTKTTQTQVRVFKLVTKKPPKNKRHTPRGGRRTCYLANFSTGAVIHPAPSTLPSTGSLNPTIGCGSRSG